MKRNKILLAYMVLLALCIVVTICQCNKSTEQLKEEVYGTTTDETIELKKDTKISTEFTATENELRGISVKYQTECEFENEKIKAELFDVETNELIAENTAVLKYERIQNKDGGSYIYFTFFQTDIKNREIRLVLSLEGEGGASPLLVISGNKINSSSLKNDNEVLNQNLVFKARYYLGEEHNVIGGILNGIFIFVLGALLISFAFKREKQKSSEETSQSAFGKINTMTRIGLKFVHKYRFQIVFLILVGFLSLYIIYVYKCSVSSAILKSGYYFLKKMYAVFSVLILLVAIVIYLFYIKKRGDIVKLYVPMALSLGIMFSLVICLDTVPDEPSHIDTAYALSNEILQIPDSEKPGYIYKRIEDIDADAEERQSLGMENYKWMYENLFKMAEDDTLVEYAVRSNLNNAGKIYYVPQALGISLGRLLGLGLVPTMMLGRLFSLICYVMLTYIAIRKIPVGKLSLFLIGILPISLQQAASMSYDGMINATAVLYLAYNVYLFYSENQIKITDIAVIAITGCMLASVKGGTYIPLCFLPILILWRRKDLQKKERYCAISLVGIFLFAFVKERLVSIISTLSAKQGAIIGGGSSQEIYTFGYLIQHPTRLFGLFMNTFHKQGSAQLRNLLGGNLAWRDVNIDWYIIIFILILLLLSCIRQKKEIYIPRVDKVYMGLLAFGSFCLVELSMLLVWTPVTFNYITGAQGRYFIPFFLLVLLCMRNSFFTLKKDIEREIVLLFGITDVIVILQVILVALE